MVEREPFEPESTVVPIDGEALVLDLDGYEGPLDVLLTLARNQRVDLTRISILELAEQYLAFVSEARRIRLEIAADYLVMAAWLAFLKSRLLLPEPADDEPSGEELAADLTLRLRRLEAVRAAGIKLFERALLGRDVFARGDPEGIRVATSAVYDVALFDLLKAYAARRGHAQARPLRIRSRVVHSVEQALKRLDRLVGNVPDWQQLERFLPPELCDGFERRSAVASTLSASLELARQGQVEIQQRRAFGPIYLRRASRG